MGTVALVPRATRGDAVGWKTDNHNAGAPTVLVVDDEPLIRSLLGCLLPPLGYAVIEASDGAEALAVLRSGATHVDVMLLDFQLPEQDGATVLRAVRALAPALPVILQTGHSTADLRARIGDLAIDGVLHKPFRAETLAALLGSVCEHAIVA